MHRSVPIPYLLAVTCLLTAAGAQTAVSPADRTQLEGSSFTHFPLGRPDARFQFLHADLPPGMVVHGHAFRRDAGQVRGLVDGFAADLQVTLSVSANTPATASSTFANNVGTGATVVLPRTVVVFPSTDRPALDPSPTFDLVVPYQLPFVLPAQPATLCVDTVMFGNSSAAGVDRNLSIYLDAHELQTNGTQEQPGFRMGSGCAATGATTLATATMSLWHLGSTLRLDVAARDGARDDGSGLVHSFLGLGIATVGVPWPFRPQCVMQSSTEHWFALPGTNDATGDLDGSIAGLPVLPAGFRLYLQVGSIKLGTTDLTLSDLTTLVTPPAAAAQLPAVRIAASTSRTATTGAVSTAVPVTQFF
jgi:hypothetical protein